MDSGLQRLEALAKLAMHNITHVPVGGSGKIVLATADAVVQNWKLSLPMSIALLLLSTYIITSLQSVIALRSSKDGREPPIKPYWIPYLGDWFGFLTARRGLVEGIVAKYGDSTPVTIKLGPAKAYLMLQPETFAPLLKATRSCTNKAFAVLVMSQMFGTKKNAIHIYKNDNSGIGSVPLPGTNVPPNLRVWYHQHRTASRFMQGESLKLIGERVMKNLSEELAKVDPSDPVDSGEWVTLPDFYKWWTRKLFAAAISAICGPYLVSLNPGFVDDFWTYLDEWPTISKFYPRFIAPKAYGARERILDAIKRWHAHAKEHSDYRLNGPNDPYWDDYWGSSWLKVRYAWGVDTGAMDDDALASEDLALFTAASANALPMAFWNLIEIYNDPSLLVRVQEELAKSIITPPSSSLSLSSPSSNEEPQLPLQFDIATVTSNPLLQSVYAEVLRMRVALFHNRSPTLGDYKLGPFTLKKGGLVTVPTPVASFHEGVWGPERTDHGRRPLTQFWAERFLVPDLDSDPSGHGKKVKFSTEGLEGGWMPYGGGSLMCPGRHLAKQEMMGSVAVFAAYFDMQVLNGVPRMDDRFFGLGAQPPGEPVPVRIRRKLGAVGNTNGKLSGGVKVEQRPRGGSGSRKRNAFFSDGRD